MKPIIIIKYAFFPLLFLAGLCACNKTFLDRNPPDQLAAGTFWKTTADADLALTGIYSYLVQGYNYTSSTNTGQGWGSGTIYWETLSDNAFSGAFSPTSTGSIEATNGNILSDGWITPYRAIEACNTFLANVGRIPMDAKTMNRYTGEVRFIRAYYYFILTQVYGDVVLALRPLGKDSSNYQLGRTAKAIVTDTIINDLNFAIANLPDTVYSGHAVKWTAEGYLAKVFIASHRWQEAAAAAQAVMNSNKFKLYTGGYRGLFLKSGPNGGQLNNPEILFSGRYSIPAEYSPADYLSTYSASFQPLPNLVSDYECTDGLPITSSPLYNAATPYNNRDPRLQATVLTPNVLYKGGIVFLPSQAGSASGFLNKKGVDSTRATVIGTQSDQDWVYLRYAEILLLYAEAQNEVAGPDASVYSAVNAVRQRPGVNMPALPASLSQDSMRTRIRHERRIELAMEGQRYFDLKRWGTDRVILPTIHDPGTTPVNGPLRTFPLRDTLWPVPQTEIDISKSYSNGNLKQTPGYN